MPKPKTYRNVIRKLKNHDPLFEEWTSRGKGSERIIYHPNINGRAESYPLKCHGKGTTIGKGTLSALIRRFKLPNNIFG